MLCKKCGLAMRIQRAWYSVSGDGAPLYNVEWACANPKCPEKGRAAVSSKPADAGEQQKGR